MKVLKVVLGLIVMLLAFWGGTWLYENVQPIYQLAAFSTSVLAFLVGVVLLALGIEECL